jgi:hypothetical protein
MFPFPLRKYQPRVERVGWIALRNAYGVIAAPVNNDSLHLIRTFTNHPLKPVLPCVPSQNGLLPDCPQRQRAHDLSLVGIVLPSAFLSSISPLTKYGPFFKVWITVLDITSSSYLFWLLNHFTFYLTCWFQPMRQMHVCIFRRIP